MARIIVFDAYGTLFKINLDNEQLKNTLGTNFDMFMDAYRHALLSYSWLYTLMGAGKDFNELASLAIMNTCSRFHINYDSVHQPLLSIYKSPHLFPDVIPVFDQLKEDGFQLNILSNGKMETLQKASIDNKIAHHLTKIFSSESVKKYKVHPQTYQQITDFFKVKAYQCFFVSSNQWDISGASSFGFKTIWLNRNDEPTEIITKSPDFVVRSLMELPEIS